MMMDHTQKQVQEMCTILFLEDVFRKLNIPWKKRRDFLRVFPNYRNERKDTEELLRSNTAGILMPDLSFVSWPREEAEKLFTRGIRLAIPGSLDWPASLDEIDDPPVWLWYKGFRPSLLDGQESCAIVGSRRPEKYTSHVCEDICRILCEKGHPVISGLALGVDRLAHEWTLRFGGIGAAILPVGITGCYPRAHQKLMEELCNNGFVASEFPPNYPLLKANFHSRNRLISGLCRTVIILQGGERSGTLITAGCAAEQNRRLLVVPGTIYMKSFIGSHQLIREGAQILENLSRLRELPSPQTPELAKLMRETTIPENKAKAREPFAMQGKEIKSFRDFLQLLAYREMGPAGLLKISRISEEMFMSYLLKAESRCLVEHKRGKLILTDKGLSCIN